MISPLSLNQLARRCQAEPLAQDVVFSAISSDSRQFQRGDLFVALRGENFDAHQFVEQAAKQGACAAVVEEKQASSLPQLVVDNTLEALGELGALNREQFKGKLVALTGSSGKTSVKEILAAILKVQAGDASRVLATEGNLNNHIGVPLTLLKLDDLHQYAVIEMGASALGEIAYLAKLAQADISVINNVGRAHIEGFGSVDNIALGKSEIYQALKENGVAVINKDDTYSDSWIKQTSHCKQITFSVGKKSAGKNKQADVSAVNIQLNSALQAKFDLQAKNKTTTVQLQLVGGHHVSNALAAASCAMALDVDLSVIKEGLESVQPVSGRMQIAWHDSDVQVIDDSYNANPDSVRAAIDALAEMTGTRILVLGEMGELGSNSDVLHAEVGAYAKQQGVEALLAVGDACQYAVDGFGEGASLFSSKQNLRNACLVLASGQHNKDKQTTFLIKGSRYMAMNTVVDNLVATLTKGSSDDNDNKQEKAEC